MELTRVENCLEGWNDLWKEYKELEVLNKDYLSKLKEFGELQDKCIKGIEHQKYRMDVIKRSLQKLPIEDEKKEEVNKMMNDMEWRSNQLLEMEHSLPKQNGMYLKIILGNVNVSILNRNDNFRNFMKVFYYSAFIMPILYCGIYAMKMININHLERKTITCGDFWPILPVIPHGSGVTMFRYKDEYEKFKLILSIIGFVLSVLNLCTNIRVLELSFMFLLVWYYCTLTIRESILKVNGSRIKGWWRLHHFISTIVSGVLLIWPNSAAWYHFRPQFMIFNVYISIVQYLQFRYQQGVLYRLKALGERHNMDITIEGFHSWMWRGLSFLLPFLYMGYLFQLYNAYTLYTLISHPDATWQVPVLSFLFLTLFLGNTITTSMVIPQKLQERMERPSQADGHKNQEKDD